MNNPDIDKYGNKFWGNEKGERHRIDGPAVEWCNGTKEWYVNNKLHRLDGPAVEFNGDKEWWIEGNRYSKEEFNKKVSEMNKKENLDIDENGDKRWYNEKGELHRIDGPAVEYADGTKYWYINGKLHRENRPAVENINGSKCWYINGKLHRLDSPAVEYADGTKYWYINGKLHRENGPAIELYNGDKEWYVNGKRYSEKEYNKKISKMNSINKKENPKIDKDGNKIWRNEKGELHRIDGPAIELYNGYKAWYIEGKNYSEEEFNKKVSEMNSINKKENPEIDEDGNKIWKNEKEELHRIDGPAVEYADGTKYWYINGKYHRLDGPAVENINGSKCWYINGKLHRLDGPAVEYADGNKAWYIEGKLYSEEEFNNKVKEMNSNKNKNIEIDEKATKIWRNEKGEYHREDGPAVEDSDGYKEWWINGKCHREDGPAIEFANKYKAWFLEGKQYTEEEYYKLIGNKSFTKEISTKDLIKDRLEKVAYRSAGRKLTQGISKVFVKIAENKGMDNSSIEIISKFFQTELGESFIGMILGVGLPNIPKLNQDKRIIKLAEEFQIESVSKVADVVLEEALQYFLPIVGDVLKALPEDNKRIELYTIEEESLLVKEMLNK